MSSGSVEAEGGTSSPCHSWLGSFRSYGDGDDGENVKARAAMGKAAAAGARDEGYADQWAGVAGGQGGNDEEVDEGDQGASADEGEEEEEAGGVAMGVASAGYADVE